MAKRIIAAGAFMAAASVATMAQAASPPSPFTGITVFGDSLSDGGNFAIAAGLPASQRFTTNPGLTAIENVAAYYGLSLSASLAGGSNYAFGSAGITTNTPGAAAGIPTETQQITAYLAANPKLDPNRLYSVWGGANDIFYHATAAVAGQVADQLAAAATAGLPPAQAAAVTAAIDAQVAQSEGVTALETSQQAGLAIVSAAIQEGNLIGSLGGAGARYIVVFNLPDIGRTPQATAENAAVPGAAAGLTTLSTTFNSALNGQLIGKTDVIPVNTFAFLNEVLASPSQYGIVNTTVPACTTSSAVLCTPQTLVTPNAGSTFLFADGVHPTTYAHQLLAQVVESEITAGQQASLLGEAPLVTLESERNAINQQLLEEQMTDQTGLRFFTTGGFARENFSDQAVRPIDHDDWLVTGGLIDRVTPDLTVGIAATGGTQHQTMNGQLSHFRTTSYNLSAFAQYVRGAAYISAAAGGGGLSFDNIERSFAIGPTTRTEEGSTKGSTISANVTAGYWFGERSLRVGPFARGIYERVFVRSYDEDSGDSTAMHFSGQTRQSLIAEAGARLQGSVPAGGTELHPYAEVAYAHDDDAHARGVLVGLTTLNGEFAIPGYAPDRNWGEAQLGVDAVFSPRVTASIGYQGRFAGKSSAYNGANVGVRFSF
jgi:outer membrane lipase/esterase